MSKTGTLFLIPSTIAEDTSSLVLPLQVLELISTLDEFIVEDERNARRFLKSIGYTKPLQSLLLYQLNKHTEENEIPEFITSLLKGKDMGLLSEAGCPCIADPGSVIVALAHKNKIPVKPLVGPSSILLSLMASGFNGQNFAFNGYLPIDKNSRIRKIKDLENKIYRENQTQIFIETPYRNMQMLNDILNNCSPSTLLCIAVNVTGKDEFIETKTISEWKKQIPEIHKRTAIFLLYKV
ncbi:MAG: SAM-dependent methyltransferase [Bacteroidetes bacterium]|nr:SAM-dependent methyltransferase [Bacteroidota bacterium]